MDWLRSFWVPTSASLLEESESRILEAIKKPLRNLFIKISNDNTIRTIKTEGDEEEKRAPLVLMHGFAAGLGFWALNIDSLAEEQSVYAIDLLGFGRSSRPSFPTDSEEVEEMYVASIEEWRKELGVEKMVLCGHSFGAYLAHAYALKHPESIDHLVLADPWGFPERPPKGEEPFRIGRVRRAIYSMLSSYNPMSVLRLAGWYGPRLVERMRPDIKEKYEGVYGEGDTRIMNYIYHCNAQQPSGETAFMNLTAGKIPVYAKRSIVSQLGDVDASIPISIIVGTDSWMMKYTEYGDIPQQFPDQDIDVKFIEDAGHHIYLDQKDEFNRILGEVCDRNEARKRSVAHAGDIEENSEGKQSFAHTEDVEVTLEE